MRARVDVEQQGMQARDLRQPLGCGAAPADLRQRQGLRRIAAATPRRCRMSDRSAHPGPGRARWPTVPAWTASAQSRRACAYNPGSAASPATRQCALAAMRRGHRFAFRSPQLPPCHRTAPRQLRSGGTTDRCCRPGDVRRRSRSPVPAPRPARRRCRWCADRYWPRPTRCLLTGSRYAATRPAAPATGADSRRSTARRCARAASAGWPVWTIAATARLHSARRRLRPATVRARHAGRQPPRVPAVRSARLRAARADAACSRSAAARRVRVPASAIATAALSSHVAWHLRATAH